FTSGDGDVAALQNFEDPGGCAGHEAGPLCGEESDVDGMESVDVLGWVDRQQHFLGVDLHGQRQLHQDPVDIVAPVEAVDHGQQLGGGGRFGGRQLFAVKI